ncbi:MAG: response regulator transcription factor [Anaerolineales bacterium]|nr:MAG: response regulator transcription factor [Anaerolineales bacterium]
MTEIRVLLVDDQQLVREGLRVLLDMVPDVRVVGEASNGAEAVELARRLKPDVVLMDVRMPELDGVAATRLIRSACPEVRVLILTTFDDDEYVFEGLRAGAAGYLLKDVPSEQLTEAIRATARGEAFIHPAVTSKVVAEFARLTEREHSRREQPLDEPLSARELEVLALLAEGLSNREIGERLFIATGTAKNHVSSILAKLGVRDRTQAVLQAQELGLL